MSKTMDDWREEFNELFKKSTNEAMKIMLNCSTDILIAFCAKYGIQPDEAILCYQGNKFWVEKKEMTEK